jgi:hypothetical protein
MTQRSPVPEWFGGADKADHGAGAPEPPRNRGGGLGCAGFALGLVIAIGAGLYAFSERQRAEKYRARSEALEHVVRQRESATPVEQAVPEPVAPPSVVEPPIEVEPELAPESETTLDAEEPAATRSAHELDQALGVLRPKLRACYETALSRAPDARGRVSVRITIAPDGSVESAEPTATGNLPAPVSSCVAGVIETARFAASEDQTIVTYPVVFGR